MIILTSTKYLGSFGFIGDVNHDGKTDLGFENEMSTYHSNAYTFYCRILGLYSINTTIPITVLSRIAVQYLIVEWYPIIISVAYSNIFYYGPCGRMFATVDMELSN
ncbi:MAG: VCBS repeat-containing protein [Candidatus Midichloria mitochondrii]